MKRQLWIAGGVVVVIGTYLVLNSYIYNEKEKDLPTQLTQHIPVEVIPISHATAVLRWGDTIFYVDPTGGAAAFEGRPFPDIMLVTDIHGDHFSQETLSAVSGNVMLVVPQAVKDQLPEKLALRARILKNGEMMTERGFQILAMPMYNLPESADSRHTKGRGNGYVIERDGFRLYVAGDTAGIPEMRTLEDIDLAFVPMNLPYTMGVEEAADAVLAFKPKRVYPYHYRGQGGLADITRFKELVNAGNPNIEVILMNWYPQ